MMLETKLKNFSKDIITYFPFGVFINGIFFIELISLISKSFIKFKNYLYLPNNILFENQETFINTEGLIKKNYQTYFQKKNEK